MSCHLHKIDIFARFACERARVSVQIRQTNIFGMEPRASFWVSKKPHFQHHLHSNKSVSAHAHLFHPCYDAPHKSATMAQFTGVNGCKVANKSKYYQHLILSSFQLAGREKLISALIRRATVKRYEVPSVKNQAGFYGYHMNIGSAQRHIMMKMMADESHRSTLTICTHKRNWHEFISTG